MKLTHTLGLLALAWLCGPAQAALDIFATVPEWAALAREVGGDQVRVFAATSSQQDPHRIEARPSLIARARNADLVVATGAELETAWLPLVLRESGNGRVQPGQPGYFEAARAVSLLEAPGRLDRTEGDIHALGNPHIQTDPRNILKVAEALAERMAELDSAHAAGYQSGYARFAEKWRAALARWERDSAPLRGVPIVSQHRAWTYLYQWLGIKEVATLEPKPGVEPSAAYLGSLRDRLAKNPPRFVIRAAYNSPRPSEWFSREAGVPVAVLPFTVGGSDQAKDLVSLFDDTIARLLKALKP